MTEPEIDKILRKILKKEVETGCDPLNVCSYIQGRMDAVTKEYLQKQYHVIEFSSPMGRESEDFIKENFDLQAEWEGPEGLVGTTTIFLPKSIALKSPKDIKGVIEILSRISPDIDLDDLFDDYSDIKIIK